MSDVRPVPSNIPIPDPSIVTAQEITRVRSELRHEFEAALSGLRSVIETRFDAKDKADIVLSENVNRVPTLLDREIKTLRDWTQERFSGLEKWMDEKFAGLGRLTDERIEGIKSSFKEDKIAASTAVNAAFAAQKEAAAAQNTSNTAAIAKSEASTTKELESLDGKITSLKESIARDIGNLTGRLDRGEGGLAGERFQTQSRQAATNLNIAIIGGVVGFFVFIIAIVSLWVSVSGVSNGHHNGLTNPAAIAVAPLNPSALAPK